MGYLFESHLSRLAGGYLAWKKADFQELALLGAKNVDVAGLHQNQMLAELQLGDGSAWGEGESHSDLHRLAFQPDLQHLQRLLQKGLLQVLSQNPGVLLRSLEPD